MKRAAAGLVCPPRRDIAAMAHPMAVRGNPACGGNPSIERAGGFCGDAESLAVATVGQEAKIECFEVAIC